MRLRNLFRVRLWLSLRGAAGCHCEPLKVAWQSLLELALKRSEATSLRNTSLVLTNEE